MYENNGIFTFTGSCTNCRCDCGGISVRRLLERSGSGERSPGRISALRGHRSEFFPHPIAEPDRRRQSANERVCRRFYVAGRNSRRHSVPARLGRRRNRRTAAECPNRPAADPCHTHRDGQFLRLVRRLGFGLYGLVERNLVSAGLYVQRRGDEGIVVDDLLPLAGQRAQYPLLRLRTL